MFHQGGAKGRRDRFGGQVVGGGTQAAGGDQQLAATRRFAQLADQALAVVADHALAEMGDAQGRQFFGQPAGIAIGDRAQQQLGADAEDLGPSRGLGSWRRVWRFRQTV